MTKKSREGYKERIRRYRDDYIKGVVPPDCEHEDVKWGICMRCFCRVDKKSNIE